MVSQIVDLTSHNSGAGGLGEFSLSKTASDLHLPQEPFCTRNGGWREAALGCLTASYLPCLLVIAGLFFPFDETLGQDNSSQTAKAAPVRPTVEDRSSRDTARTKGDITFDDLKFDIEKDGKFERKMLTPEIEELHKKTLRIRGYILPASVFKQSGIEEFVLVRDNMECCFGPGAAIYDCIMVQMEKGKTASFTTRPVAVRGKFEIKEFKYPESEDHYAIYQIIATEVK